MTDYFRRHLGAKLLLSYLMIILIGAVVLIVASQFALPTSFDRHMAGMGAMMGGMGGPGQGQGFGRLGAMSQLYADFRAGFNEALFYAAFAATLVAVILGFYLSRSVVAPIRAMSLVTERVAEGHYEER